MPCFSQAELGGTTQLTEQRMGGKTVYCLPLHHQYQSIREVEVELKRSQTNQNQSALGREQFCSPVVQPVFSSANAPDICSSTGTHTIALARNNQKACPGSEIPQPQPPSRLFEMLQGCFRKEQASVLPTQVGFPFLVHPGLGMTLSFPRSHTVIL